MANNRLYIVDPVTGERFMLAKSFGVWCMCFTSEEFRLWLRSRDRASAAGERSTTLVLDTDYGPEESTAGCDGGLDHVCGKGCH